MRYAPKLQLHSYHTSPSTPLRTSSATPASGKHLAQIPLPGLQPFSLFGIHRSVACGARSDPSKRAQPIGKPFRPTPVDQ